MMTSHQLVLQHLKYIYKIAYRLRGYNVPFEDLVQEGVIGFLKALNKFNPAFKVDLIVYATPWIRSEMFNFIIGNMRIVKLGNSHDTRKMFFHKAEILAGHDNGLIAKKLQVDEREVRAYSVILGGYDVPYFDNQYTGTSAWSADPSLIVEGQQSLQNMQIMYERLEPRTQRILGANIVNGTSLTALAKQLGISNERVRQIRNCGLEAMGYK